MSTQKRFEIGVDYEGVSSRHLQVNEEVIFSNEEASRIFMPECGSFYVDSLKIKDNSTGRELVQGFDYDVFIEYGEGELDILQDTREQNPLGLLYPVIRTSLDFGDYVCKQNPKVFHIDTLSQSA